MPTIVKKMPRDALNRFLNTMLHAIVLHAMHIHDV